MQYTPRQKDSKDPDTQLFFSLEPLIKGIGMTLIELYVFRIKGRGAKAGGAQIKAIVYREGVTAVEDCTNVHRLIMPRLELAFPGHEIYLEVSSPGIDRIVKDGREFIHYIGREVNCYRPEISDWTAGIITAADEKQIKLLNGEEEINLPYEAIAKAKLIGSKNIGG
jgi:ribosome maturation factor RimP